MSLLGPHPAAYVGRLAPSPTGLLHLGHAFTFLTAAERAQGTSGGLLLRIDDLDRDRSREHFVEAIREDLHWLGVSWTAEVRQSERHALYEEAMRQLLLRGYAYPCTCSRKELQRATQAPHEGGEDEPVYNGHCRPAPHLRVMAFHAATSYRFRVPEGEVVRFVDANLGEQQFLAGYDAAADFGDFLVWRKDGSPSYQLACAVDDAAMEITEAVRGRDLLKSTARQILLQRALDLSSPAYFHTELLRDDCGQRLAKRHDALSLRALREAGVTPPELRNRLHANLHHKQT